MSTTEQHESAEVKHEASDINAGAVLWFIGILSVATVLVLLLTWGVFHWFEGNAVQAEPPPNSRVGVGIQRLPPEPRLQLAPGHESHPLEDMQKLREQETKRLTGYGWVDQGRGIVHIPIDQAKKLLLERAHTTPVPQDEWQQETRPSSPSSGRMPERRNP